MSNSRQPSISLSLSILLLLCILPVDGTTVTLSSQVSKQQNSWKTSETLLDEGATTRPVRLSRTFTVIVVRKVGIRTTKEVYQNARRVLWRIRGRCNQINVRIIQNDGALYRLDGAVKFSVIKHGKTKPKTIWKLRTNAMMPDTIADALEDGCVISYRHKTGVKDMCP